MSSSLSTTSSLKNVDLSHYWSQDEISKICSTKKEEKALFVYASPHMTDEQATQIQNLDNVFIRYLEGLSEESLKEFFKCRFFKGTNALEVAILFNRSVVALKLLDLGIDKEHADDFGWKPIHHAALCCQKIYDELIGRGADASSKTHLGASVEDLRRMTGILPSQPQTLYFRTQENGVESISPEELCKRTGFSGYIDDPVFPHSFYGLLWNGQGKKTSMDSKTITPYEKMKAHPPQLIVGPHLSLKSQKHFALFAGENLSAGQAISEYTGILEELEHNTNFYNLVSGSEQGYSYGISADYERSLNAEYCGNLLRFANDGWPNSVIIAVSGVKGMSVRPVLFAGEDIQQNREICWDYGPMHDLKWGRYCLMNRQEMREFFKKGLLEAYIEFAHKGSDIEDRKQDATIAEIAALECLKGKFTYLLNTPAALIDLVISDIISPNEYVLFSTSLPMMKKAILSPTHQNWMLQLVSVLNDLQKALVKKDKLVAKVIKLSILLSLDKLTVVQVIKEMDVISKNFKARNATEAKSELAALEESLKNYKFLDDPDFPLSVELVTKEKVKDEKQNF